MGQYDDRTWLTKGQRRARTIHSRYGSWKQASEAVGVSHNTLRSWARGDTSPKAEQLTKMNRMVGQYRGSDSAMKEITKNAIRQDRIADRRKIRERNISDQYDAEDRADDLAATPLFTKRELENVTDLLDRARESDDSDDWKDFRLAAGYEQR